MLGILWVDIAAVCTAAKVCARPSLGGFDVKRSTDGKSGMSRNVPRRLGAGADGCPALSWIVPRCPAASRDVSKNRKMQNEATVTQINAHLNSQTASGGAV